MTSQKKLRVSINDRYVGRYFLKKKTTPFPHFKKSSKDNLLFKAKIIIMYCGVYNTYREKMNNTR